MKNNFFLNAYKYKETKVSSQLENFTTECFVFILKYLISEKNKSALEILSLFGVDYKYEMGNIYIETQTCFYVPYDFVDVDCIPTNQKFARPDITIWIDKKELTFIEVKIDAPLNRYFLKIKQIDQIDFYKNIKTCKSVYLLSRHNIDKENFKDQYKIRWFKIYEILKNEECLIIKEFLYFLDLNYLGERKMLDNNCLNILDTIASLSSLLENGWNSAGITKYKLNSNMYINQFGFGWYILKKNQRNSATKDFSYFIGINKTKSEKYKNQIVFWVDEKIENFEDKFIEIDNGYIINNTLDLNTLIQISDVDEQEKKNSAWVIEYIKPILENDDT